MTATAVVGSAAEDTTPSEREAPQRFAWWHPQSADLGRRAERRDQLRGHGVSKSPMGGGILILPSAMVKF